MCVPLDDKHLSGGFCNWTPQMLRKIGVQHSDHIGACYTGKVLGCTSAQQKQKSLKKKQKKIKANKQKSPWDTMEAAGRGKAWSKYSLQKGVLR